MPPKKLTILIVEDNLSFALELEMLLEKMGHTVVGHIENGEEGYDFIYLHRPDVILMDVELDGFMSGTELGQRIAPLNIPIVYLTSSNNEQIFREAQQSNMIAYLVKPVNKYSLKAAIDNAMQYALKQVKPTTKSTQGEATQEHLFVKKEGIYEKLYIPDILYIHSNHNHCHICMRDSATHQVRIPLSSLEGKLPTEDFLRIHRQYIVQLREIHSIDLRNYVLMIGEQQLPISRSKRLLLEQMIDRLK